MAYERSESARGNFGKFIFQQLTKTKTFVMKLERILIKFYRQNVFLLFNQICLNEGLLPDYIYMCVCVCVYSYAYVSIYMCVCVCVYVFLCIFLWTYICVYIHVFVCIYIYIYIYSFIYMYSWVCLCLCVIACKYTYICLRVYIYVCVCPSVIGEFQWDLLAVNKLIQDKTQDFSFLI